MNEPEVWKDIKKRELEQIRVEEDDQIKKDREIPLEESSEKEDDLVDALEAEFKQDVANILSDKIRDIQTKDLKKEREEAANVIKNTLKQKRVSKATDGIKSSEARSEKPKKIEKVPEIEKAWNLGPEGESEEFIPENPVLFTNLDKKTEGDKPEKENKLNIIKPIKVAESGVNYSDVEKGKKKKGDTEDYKEKRKEFLEKQKKKKSEENIKPVSPKKPQKTNRCLVF